MHVHKEKALPLFIQLKETHGKGLTNVSTNFKKIGSNRRRKGRGGSLLMYLQKERVEGKESHRLFHIRLRGRDCKMRGCSTLLSFELTLNGSSPSVLTPSSAHAGALSLSPPPPTLSRHARQVPFNAPATRTAHAALHTMLANTLHS